MLKNSLNDKFLKTILLGCSVEIDTFHSCLNGGYLIRSLIKASICDKRFEWILIVDDDVLDITPVPSSFSLLLDYDPYASEIRRKILQFDLFHDNVFSLVQNLINDILNCQNKYLRQVSNERLLLNLEMIREIENNVILLLFDENQSQKASVQFPLLNKSRLASNELDYLIDVTASQPIQIVIHFTVGADFSHTIFAESSLIFPSEMTLSRSLNCTDLLPVWTKDTIITDYLAEIEGKFAIGWNARRVFVEELRRIAAVVEFDPVDFSFVSIALRQRIDKRYAVCTVEFRLSNSFPQQAPFLTIYDLQTSFCNPIESSSVKFSSSWGAERSAREMLLTACDFVHKQAFG